MEPLEDDTTIEYPRPRTATVLVLLIGAALTLSYLGAYALTNALLTAELISPWPTSEDPRPRYFLTGFLGLSGLFIITCGLFRLMSWRQLRRIDAMAGEE